MTWFLQMVRCSGCVQVAKLYLEMGWEAVAIRIHNRQTRATAATQSPTTKPIQTPGGPIGVRKARKYETGRATAQ